LGRLGGGARGALAIVVSPVGVTAEGDCRSARLRDVLGCVRLGMV
jgi:hypothetical protein